MICLLHVVPAVCRTFFFTFSQQYKCTFSRTEDSQNCTFSRTEHLVVLPRISRCLITLQHKLYCNSTLVWDEINNPDVFTLAAMQPKLPLLMHYFSRFKLFTFLPNGAALWFWNFAQRIRLGQHFGGSPFQVVSTFVGYKNLGSKINLGVKICWVNIFWVLNL